jgi:hypothetical protein
VCLSLSSVIGGLPVKCKCKFEKEKRIQVLYSTRWLLSLLFSFQTLKLIQMGGYILGVLILNKSTLNQLLLCNFHSVLHVCFLASELTPELTLFVLKISHFSTSLTKSVLVYFILSVNLIRGINTRPNKHTAKYSRVYL